MSRRARILLPALLVTVLLLAGGGAFALLRDDKAAPGTSTARLVFAEFSATNDRIVTAPADDPAQRTLVAAVDHLDGWGVNPALAPAGTLIAYTVLPVGAQPRPDSPAEVWVLDIRDGKPRRLAGDADLRVPPVLSRDGRTLVYRSSASGGRQSLVRIELATSARKPVFEAETAFGLFPIGFAQDGALVYASLSTRGTDLFRLPDGGQPALLLHASDQLAREWRMAPDGSGIAFLAPKTSAERVQHRLEVFAIEGPTARAVDPASNPAAVEQFGAAWRPDGKAITVGVEPVGAQSAAATTLSLTAGGAAVRLAAPLKGFDAPISWSANGEALAVRSFDGASATAPGRETTVVITDGQRHAVTASGDVIVFGWISE